MGNLLDCIKMASEGKPYNPFCVNDKEETIKEFEKFTNEYHVCDTNLFKKVLSILKEDNERQKTINKTHMIKIRDYRGTGRTSRLILLAKETGATLVVPTCRMRDYVDIMAKRYGIEGVNVITFDDFINQRHDRNTKYIIDNLDIIMQDMNVIGYSDLKED